MTPNELSLRQACRGAATMAVSLCWLAASIATAVASAEEVVTFDWVISNGRVVDPESGLDGIRNIGIRNGSVATIDSRSLTGHREIDATGLIVAPGFIDAVIDLPNDYRAVQLLDGVTTALNLQVGTSDVDRWYRAHEASVTHYGVTIGHERIRRVVMGDEGTVGSPGDAMNRAASDTEMAEMVRRIESGLGAGALAVSITNTTHAASGWEMLEVFRTAASADAVVWGPPRETGDWEADDMPRYLAELVGTAAVTGASLHIVHLQASGGPHTPRLLTIVAEARARGLDVSAEVFPYSANMSHIRYWNTDDWQSWPDEWFHDLESMSTGERLKRETFPEFLEDGGYVIVHNEYIEPIVREAVSSPLTMLVSGAWVDERGHGHPRTAGTHARVLGHYVRELGALSMVEAIRKMSLMPAQRLEARVPAMGTKGRIRLGSDADIVVFDPGSIIDRSTFQDPLRPSFGVRYLLIGGVPMVWDGEIQVGQFPGQPIRAATESGQD